MRDYHWCAKYLVLLAICATGAREAGANIITVPGGYETSYGIRMNPGTSNGSDIESVFVFEWDGSNYSSFFGGEIAGSGDTYLNHTVDFFPTSALILGFGAGIAGVGDEIDHLYTITSLAFSSTVGGLKWSEAFPGVTPDSRVGHNAMVGLLKDAQAGSSSAMTALDDWVASEGYRAAFNPSGNFAVLEWSVCGLGKEIIHNPDGTYSCEEVGGSIPEPGTWLLLVIGLMGLVTIHSANYRRNVAAYS